MNQENRQLRNLLNHLIPGEEGNFFYVKNLLEAFGRNLAYPHAKYLGDDIFELRFKGTEGHIRTLYFFHSGNCVIFTNGFIKKTGKTPHNQKQTAMDRRKNYLQRRLFELLNG